MRLVIGTWYSSSDLGTTLSERWKNVGALWVNGDVSEPLEFRVEPFVESTCDEKIGLKGEPLKKMRLQRKTVPSGYVRLDHRMDGS